MPDKLLVPVPFDLPSKTGEIMLWFNDDNQKLKRLIYEIRSEGNSNISLRRWRFDTMIDLSNIISFRF
jgi:hypothetical protein